MPSHSDGSFWMPSLPQKEHFHTCAKWILASIGVAIESDRLVASFLCHTVLSHRDIHSSKRCLFDSSNTPSAPCQREVAWGWQNLWAICITISPYCSYYSLSRCLIFPFIGIITKKWMLLHLLLVPMQCLVSSLTPAMNGF